MKKILLIILGSLGLIVVGGIIYYNSLPKPTVVVEQEELPEIVSVTKSEEIEDPTTVIERDVDVKIKSIGSFNFVDPSHYAKGNAVVKTVEDKPILELNDFSSADAPDLFVYLSKESGLTELNSDPGEFASLGPLKTKRGTQQYNLPEDYEDYNSVLIWCRAFNVLVSAADLNRID